MENRYFEEEDNFEHLTETYIEDVDGLHGFHQWAYGSKTTVRMREFHNYTQWDYIEGVQRDLDQVHMELMEYNLENENYEVCAILEDKYLLTRDDADTIQIHMTKTNELF